MVARWSWLGDSLAIDLANTVRRRGLRYVDLITSPAELSVWLDHERGRLPIPARVDEALLAEFLTVRDQVLRLTRAAVAGGPLPAADVAAINERVAAAPTVRLLATQPGRHLIKAVTRTGPGRRLLADLAVAVIDLLASPEADDLYLCDAPGCGQLYLRGRANQNWCSAYCGSRARSQRHNDRTAQVALEPVGELAPYANAT